MVLTWTCPNNFCKLLGNNFWIQKRITAIKTRRDFPAKPPCLLPLLALPWEGAAWVEPCAARTVMGTLVERRTGTGGGGGSIRRAGGEKNGDFPASDTLAFCFWARSTKRRESSGAEEEESRTLCQLPILLCFSELDSLKMCTASFGI